jgi:hypothetical protein
LQWIAGHAAVGREPESRGGERCLMDRKVRHV